MGNKKELRRAATLGLDRKVKECAQVVGDRHLLAQLAAGDMVAINAVYHCACLTRLYRKAETVGCDSTDSNATQVIRAPNDLSCRCGDQVIDHLIITFITTVQYKNTIG